MAVIYQVRTVLSGFVGAPGYNQMYFFGGDPDAGDADLAVGHVCDFWEAVGQAMPQITSWSVQPDVDVLNPASGALIEILATTPTAQVAHGPSGNYAGGVGACATWLTAAVHGSKQLKGRTFIVPMAGAAYDSDGTLGSGTLASLRAAATTLAAVANFGVWGRPISGAGGAWSAATGGTVRDQVSYLSSRRT